MNDVTLLLWIERGRTAAALLVAIGVAGEFVGDWIASPIRKRIDAVKEAEIAALNKEAGDARRSAGEATERAAKLEKEAADLKRRAEEERLARVRIEEKLAPRQISAAQETKLQLALKPLSGKQIFVFFVTGQPENERFAMALATALTKAGINVKTRPGIKFGGGAESGISLMFGKNRTVEAEIVANALVVAELATKPVPIGPSSEDDLLQIVVAPK